MQPLSHQNIQSVLARAGAGPFGASVAYYEQVGSTNDIARKLAEAHAPEGTLVVADEQTAGRGRLGRTWIAPPDTSLLMSVIFRPTFPAGQAYRLVMACGLAAAEASELVTGVEVGVKWPNDLHIAGLKVAGILPESAIIAEKLAWVIVGMGINVNQAFTAPDPLAATATSLRMAAGQEIDRGELLGAIMKHLRSWHERIGGAALAEAWRDRCMTIGQRIRVETKGLVVEGVAQDIDPGGALWLQEDTGARRLVAAGEASVLP
jgi:BirA family biotin operon repressor/biotin-[acetyl-CoA-carboxylase] ligase